MRHFLINLCPVIQPPKCGAYVGLPPVFGDGVESDDALWQHYLDLLTIYNGLHLCIRYKYLYRSLDVRKLAFSLAACLRASLLPSPD